MKKRLIQFTTMILTIICLFSFVACGRSEDSKVTNDTLQIKILNKGYGTEWLEKIVDQYVAETGKKAKVVEKTSNPGKFLTEITSGPSANKTDLYFTIDAEYFLDIISKGENQIPGYDCVFADITDVYNEKLPDYDKSLKEMMPEYYLDAMTYNGKNYTLPWAQAVEGIVYNEVLMNQYNLKLPNTTGEMLALFEQIIKLNNGSCLTKDFDGNNMTIYPLYYARENNYLMYAWLTWWAQYEGIEGYNNFLKGMDNDGNYTYEIFAQEGRQEGLQVVYDMILQSNNYTNKDSLGFQTAQTYFLNGLSFFNFNGDWLEREAKANASIEGFKIMKTPVISSIVNKLENKAMTDATLSAVITAIDSGATSYEGVNAKDFATIKTARELVLTEGDAHIACIPSYSNMIDEAKEFLKYYLSKKGQNLQMKYSYGNVAPFRRDVTTLEEYAYLSDFAKSKFTIWNSSEFLGRKYNTPMTYKGGLTVFNTNRWPERIFGSDQVSTVQTVEEYIIEDLRDFESKWSNFTRQAGVN